MIKVILRRSAQKDILDAARFYEKQERGLGRKVAEFLDAKVMELAATAGIILFKTASTGRLLTEPFPTM